MKEFISIKNWASEDRPREKLVEKGTESLSNSELLAILINTGTQNRSALDIAKDILGLANQNLLELSKLSLHDIQKVKGMGEKKAVTLIAALELGKRRQLSAALERPMVKNSRDLFDILSSYFLESNVEMFYVMFLNQANRVISVEALSSGGMTSTVVDIRLIFKRALELPGATKIALAHNHPSGNLKASPQDDKMTERVKEAGKIMDINLLDHLIIANNLFYSYADDGKL